MQEYVYIYYAYMYMHVHMYIYIHMFPPEMSINNVKLWPNTHF